VKPVVKEYENAIVIDHFLPSDLFQELKRTVGQFDYAFAARNKWQKQYDIVETPPLEGPVFASKSLTIKGKSIESPTVGPIRGFIDTILERQALIEKMTYPKLKAWDTFGVRPFLYARGSSLGWHTDGAKVAAYTYYLHDTWGPDWGGEISVLECEPGMHSRNANAFSFPKELIHYDVKQFFPVPNRFILIKGSAWHCVRRVEAAAGSNLRMALSGFFFDSSELV